MGSMLRLWKERVKYEGGGPGVIAESPKRGGEGMEAEK